MTNFEKYNNYIDNLVFNRLDYDNNNSCVVIYYQPKHAKDLIQLYAGVCKKGDENLLIMKWGLSEVVYFKKEEEVHVHDDLDEFLEDINRTLDRLEIWAC